MNSNLSTGGSYLLVAKNVRYEKCLCCRITTAMYAIQSLCILALSIMITATYTAYGFTIFIIGLSILLFLFRLYIWFRDGDEITDLCLTILSNSLIMTVYIFALVISIRWRKYMIGLKKRNHKKDF
uniref:Uncharacterized protein n=1 Tax=Wuchereria bancrofti TaxID=6293 RepID=A0A1I8EV81_WUCBA